jgi:cytochrome c oxidase assembly protein subunit 15
VGGVTVDVAVSAASDTSPIPRAGSSDVPGDVVPSRATERIAMVAAFITLLLLVLGGVVTSRDAGMIYPDWPLSNGSVNPDGWLRNMDMFSEHGHRILGALAGIATIALAIALQRTDPRRWMRGLGWFAVIAVTGQGILGGARVWEANTFLALLHGCTGQMFLCLMVGLAVLARRRPIDAGPSAHLVAYAALGAWAVTLFQVVLGARVRHIHGPVQDHLLGAVVVGGSIVLTVTLVALFHRHRGAIRRPALLVMALLLGQAGVGIATADVLSPDNRTWDVTLAQILLPSLHQALGALLLASLAVLFVRAAQRSRNLIAVEDVSA